MEEAEHWFNKGKLDRALSSANLAVVRAPTNGKDITPEELTVLPMSLWMRSEILLKKLEFELCLNDLQLAVKYHIPEKLKGDAYLRMGRCYFHLGDKNKCKVAVTVSQKCGSIEVQEQCKKIMAEVENNLPHIGKDLLESEFPPDMSVLSKFVTVKLEAGYGRHVKANQQISVGDFVYNEEPYVSALLIEKHGTHCLHCYTRLTVPIPCPDCSGVAFCSIKCLNSALKYHKWECHYMELAMGSGMSILSHLALRVITQQSHDYFKNVESKSHDYQKFLNLEGHFEKRDGDDLLHRTLMALFLLQLLRHGGYFNSNSVKEIKHETELSSLTPDEIHIGTLLLRHLLVLQYNAHEIYETIIPKGNESSQGKTLYVALGIYLSAAMLNHDCQPTLARYFEGKKIILRAQRPISAGECVTENYGPVFTMKTREQRQKVLRGRYLFDCNCTACIQDWPKLENMKPDKAFFRCKNTTCIGKVPDTTGICDVCSDMSSIDESKVLFLSYQNDWDSCIDLMGLRKFKEAEKIVVLYINKMWKLVKQPNKSLCLAQEALRTIWANTSGNASVLHL